MPFPDEFYYLLAASQACYTDIPTAHPDFDRILKFEPDCFIDHARRMVRIPKKLILADWTADNWDPFKVELVSARFVDLISQGFELYIWEDHNIKPLTLKSLSSLKTNLKFIRPENPKKILEVVLKQIKQASIDNVLVLNDCWVNRLVNPEDSSIKPQLKLSDMAILSTLDLSNLLTFSTVQLEEEGVILDELSVKTLRALNYLRNTIPALKIKTAVEILKVTNNRSNQGPEFKELERKLDFRQLKGLELSDVTIQDELCLLQQATHLSLQSCSLEQRELSSLLPEPLPFLKRLNIDKIQGTIDLRALLEKTPALEWFSFQHCQVTGDNMSTLPSSQLRFLNAEYSDLTTEILQPLIEKSTKLESLHLNKCYMVTPFAINPTAALLPCLKTIVVTSMPFEILQHFMDRAVNLEEIRFQYGNIQNDLLFHKTHTRLKKIAVNCTRLTAHSWRTLLENKPNLEELDLEDIVAPCESLTSILPDTPLPKLKHLRLTPTFKSLDLYKLLRILPNLKKFDFSCYRTLTGDLSGLPPELKCPNIRTIYLRDTNLQSENLKILVEKTYNLESLTLADCQHLESNFSEFAEVTTFPHLKLIKITDSNIPAKNLSAILEKTSTLERLILFKCKNIAGAFSGLPLEKNFSNLKSLVLYDSPLNAEDMPALLKKIPNIEEISLHSCDLYFLDQTIQYPHLKHICLKQVRLLDYSLKHLIENSPLLNRIEYNNCELADNFSQLKPSAIANLGELFLMTPLPAKEIVFLLENAPKLYTFILNNPDIEEILSLINPQTRLNALVHIDFNRDFRKFNTSTLKKLLSIAPNLDIQQEIRHYLKSSIASQKKKDANQEKTAQNKPQDSSPKMAEPSSLKKLVRDAPAHSENKLSPQKRHVNANTHLDPNKRYDIKRIFYSTKGEDHPEISSYRLESFHNLTVNKQVCPMEKAFELCSEEDKQLKPCSIKVFNEDVFAEACSQNLIYGIQSFSLREQWQAVASLSPLDEIQFYRTKPANAHIEIQYSQRDNLYYIRSKTGPMTLDLEFGLKVPISKPLVDAKVILQINAQSPQIRMQNFYNDALPLEIRIQNLVCDLNLYGKTDLCLIDPDESTGEDYLEAILACRTGRCEQRAIAFKALMARVLPKVQTRIINNDCHSFVEVYLQGQWHGYDLGGYPAKVVVKEPLKIERAIPTPLEKKPEPDLRPAQNPYIPVMQTWTKKESKEGPFHPLNLSQELLKPRESIHKTLIELTSLEAVNTMVLNIQGQGKANVFTINSPSDVVCKADFMKREGSLGKITQGPGGPLHAFLTAAYSDANPPVLLINYANFKASDIVALNDLLNRDDPRADGISLPKNTKVIGVINTRAPGVYQGSDFYSRFDQKISQDLTQVLSPLPFLKECKETEVINLFHASDWKAQLLGHWTITSTGFCFKEGLLKAAIASGKPIEIQNGLWDDPEFLFFWQQAYFLGEVKGFGETIQTQGIRLLKQEGYHWDLLNTHYQIQQEPDLSSVVLNPNQLSEFFGSYHYDKKTQKLSLDKGLLEKAHDAGQKILKVQLTRSLCESDWARLLSHCQTFDVRLQVSLSKGVTLPHQVCEFKVADEKTEPWNINPAATEVIQSTDPDTTIAMLKAKDPTWIVLDVSECRPSDLLMQTRPIYNKAELDLCFSQTKGALLAALKKKQKILLTGDISEELADALAPLLLKRQNKTDPRGKLLIVSKHTDSLNYLSNIKSHQVRLDDKAPFLETLAPTDEELCILKAREKFPKGAKGLMELKYDESALGVFNPQTSSKDSLAFFAERNRLIKEKLFDLKNPSPAVFITGLSGVGKSTFIEKEFMKGEAHKVYSEQEMEQWASPEDSEHPKILFIDEANLSPRLWSEMEGLYHNNPPQILIKGTVHTLSPNHKVIFAGNPVNYGDERKLAPFFLRHPCAIEFKPLPLAVIYEQVLKPVFENTALADFESSLCKPILEAYAFLCRQSTQEVLISPRELQMIALLTSSYCKQMPGVDPILVAKHYQYEIVKPLVPSDKLAEFKALFGDGSPDIPPLPFPLAAINASPVFKATDSRLPILNRLHELLLVRESRQQGKNDPQRFGGLGGIILEGDSAVGKSVLVQALLGAHGFQEEDNLNEPSTKTKPFYRMNVAASTLDKEKLLIKAFYEGAVVVIDEINSSPMMERLLNDLLMGKLPEHYKKDNQPIKPGFMIIGTQNPVSLAGRRPCSNALSRRLITMDVPNYSAKELLEIVEGDTLYPEEVRQEFKRIIDAFLSQSEQAKEHHYLPAPTLREVFREADKVKKQMAAFKPKSLSPQCQGPDYIGSVISNLLSLNGIFTSNPNGMLSTMDFVLNCNP